MCDGGLIGFGRKVCHSPRVWADPALGLRTAGALIRGSLVTCGPYHHLGRRINALAAPEIAIEGADANPGRVTRAGQDFTRKMRKASSSCFTSARGRA
jgi:hypothetical protein